MSTLLIIAAGSLSEHTMSLADSGEYTILFSSYQKKNRNVLIFREETE